jgi:hypothetical protein
MEHHFNTVVAREYGIEEAILLHHFYFWIIKNAANGKHFHEGLYWTYNSKKAYADFFTYMNETKIFRVIKHLEDEGIIVKGNFNEDKWNKTNWYALTVKGLKIMENNGYDTTLFSASLQNATFDCVKMNDGACQNEQSNTDIITDKNNKEEDIIISSKKNDYQAIIDCWNEYNGKSWGKVLRLSTKRKRIIKSALDNQGVTQEELMRLFKTFPYADSWLFHPTKEHKDWKPDFDWWMRDTNGWLTKALEGKVHNANSQAFNDIMQGGETNATYTPQGRNIWFDEGTQSYWSMDSFYDGHIYDGYDDGNRPDGAEITLNNGRGKLRWGSSSRKWEKV